MRRVVSAVVVVVTTMLIGPVASAGAAQLISQNGALGATNGIAIGPDGNYWISEEFNFPGSVVRMSPSGVVLGRFTVGDLPNTVVAGPGGRVWVAVTSTGQLAWFDALSVAPTPHFVQVATIGVDCGPVALAAGFDGFMYFSLPTNDDTNCFLSDRVGRTADDGSGSLTLSATGRGRARDLEVAGGKLFVPDIDGNQIFRFTLGGNFALEATVTTPTTSGPDGIASDGAGNIWVTERDSGNVGRFAATQGDGPIAQEYVPPAGALVTPFGIVAGTDGFIYVAGRDSVNIARLSPSSGAFAFYPLPGADPYNIINGTDGDPRITDRNQTRIVRFVNSAPIAATGAAAGTGPTSASTSATVNPRGNDTSVVFDYGPTAAYGSTSAPIALPAGADGVALTGVLSGLVPSTTYHVRVRATNVEGSTAGGDTTFVTAAGDADGDGVAPPADCNDANKAIHPGAVDKPGDKIDQDCSGKDATFPELTATTNFTYRFFRTATRVTKIEITRLRGGETATLRCTGRRCPFKVKTYKKLKKGKRAFGAKILKRRLLPVGTKLSVRVTKAASIGTATALTVRRARAPKISRSCVKPGASKPSKCP
jgi:streptogramin lyase